MSRGGPRKGAGRPKQTQKIYPRMRIGSLVWLEEAAKKQDRSFGEILSDLVDDNLRPQVYREFKNAGQLLKDLAKKLPPDL